MSVDVDASECTKEDNEASVRCIGNLSRRTEKCKLGSQERFQVRKRFYNIQSEKKEHILCSESEEHNGVGLMNLSENYSKKGEGEESFKR